jgi:hypothetical protein
MRYSRWIAPRDAGEIIASRQRNSTGSIPGLRLGPGCWYAQKGSAESRSDTVGYCAVFIGSMGLSGRQNEEKYIILQTMVTAARIRGVCLWQGALYGVAPRDDTGRIQACLGRAGLSHDCAGRPAPAGVGVAGGPRPADVLRQRPDAGGTGAGPRKVVVGISKGCRNLIKGR